MPIAFKDKTYIRGIMVKVSSTKKDSTKDYDLAIIGSGPAGIHAAIQASKLHKKVCIIEKNPKALGGAWIQTGTLPSKTLRESLATIQSIRFHAGSLWVDRIIQDLISKQIFTRSKNVSKQEEELVRKHLAGNNVEVIKGLGIIEDRNLIRIVLEDGGHKLIESQHILIATGSSPRRPDNIPFDGWRVIDSDEILNLESIPKSMTIYGGGVVGCEYACMFAILGVETTLVDSRSQLMQQLDQQIISELQRSMEALGIKFKLGKELKNVVIKGPQVHIDLGGETIVNDILFFAAGRLSNSKRIGLEKLGISINDRGAIMVNSHFQTSIPNIYAAGDVIGPPALAATSAEQGRHAICHAFGAPHKEFPKVFPVGVYTVPELSSVGPTEEELKSAGVDYVVGSATYAEIARGHIRGDAHGILKLLVCRKTHKILAIHIVGADACNLVHIGQAFMTKGAYAQDLVNMIFNYPTLAEGYRVAAFNALNQLFAKGMIEDPPAVHDDSNVAA